jgi:Zn-dependent peptidase ImmA (M78 family)/transcriptional regulator with XRE-family HTH domain
MNPRDKKIGALIRRRRRDKGLSQAEVAPVLGFTRPTIQQIESGSRAVKAREMDVLASLFDCSAAELLPMPQQEDPQESDALAELWTALPDLQTDPTFSAVLEAARALTTLEDLLELDATVSVLPTYGLTPPKTAWQAARQGYRASEDERRRLALGEGPIRFVDELLAIGRVRPATAKLPRGVTSVCINQPDVGRVVIVNERLELADRRACLAHGLAHALFDLDGPWRICREEDETDLSEIRANAFSSGLLMPAHGVSRFLETLGKETLARGSKGVLALFSPREGDPEQEAVRVSGRARVGRHAANMCDLTRLAHYYGVSRDLAAYRLHNLRLLPEDQLQWLRRQNHGNVGRRAEETLSLHEPDPGSDVLRSRVASLAAEAHCRGLLDDEKFARFAATAGLSKAEHGQLLAMAQA